MAASLVTSLASSETNLKVAARRAGTRWQRSGATVPAMTRRPSSVLLVAALAGLGLCAAVRGEATALAGRASLCQPGDSRLEMSLWRVRGDLLAAVGIVAGR